MKYLDPTGAASGANSAGRDRPATAVIHDSDDLRLIVFKIAAGGEVPAHRSTSTVMLTVLEGSGTLTGELDGELVHQPCGPGDIVTYEPNETHGMRAGDVELLLLATITPRPGSSNATTR